MAYFLKFPLVGYTANNNIDYDIATDITKRVALSDAVKANFSVYDEYDVKDGETPELVSYKFYDTTEYHWVILMLNDIIDPRYEWVMPQDVLQRYCDSKYANAFGIHHYVDIDTGLIVDDDFPGATSVSNYVYEEEINESRRRIKILKPEYITGISTEFDRLING
tara:strand:- start:385 stop:879 length:495 start_codon:yes stop_codon:yes gene_type:complete